MISATHTHTGPVLDPSGASAANRPVVKDYLAGLPAKIAEAVRRAEARLTPARVFAACGREDSIAFNRRFHMKDGTVGWNPGKLNPEHHQARRHDRSRGPGRLLRVERRASRWPRMSITPSTSTISASRRSRPTCRSRSARSLADFKGPEMITSVLGRLLRRRQPHRRPLGASPSAASPTPRRMGTILAAEVLRTWPRLGPIEADPAPGQEARSCRSRLPALSERRCGKARRDRRAARGFQGEAAELSSRWCGAFKVLDVAAGRASRRRSRFRSSHSATSSPGSSLPGEIFVELGLAIKQDSPFPRTIIAELANGAIGYIPARRAYAQGNYEVDQRPLRRGLGRAAGQRGRSAARGVA